MPARRMLELTFRSAVCLFLVGLAGTGPLEAQEREFPDRGNRGFHYAIHPAFWAANINGDVTVNGSSIAVHDTVLDAGFQGSVEAGKGRWKGIGTFQASSMNGNSLIEGPDLPDDTFGDYKFNFTMAELFAAVEFGSFETAQALEFLVGMRYVRHSLDVAPGPGTFVARENWVEPVVGARYYAEMGRSFWVTIDGNMGGFGIGSKVAWVIGGTLAVRVTKRIDATLATRFYQTEYQNDNTGYLWDEGMVQGWHIGLRWKG